MDEVYQTPYQFNEKCVIAAFISQKKKDKLEYLDRKVC